ncbi:MAG: rhomboid family intramembrane serine protease [Rikenellaceae bacterium]
MIDLRRTTPPVVLNLIIINMLSLMATYLFPQVEYLFGLRSFESDYFRLYQVITYMFLHADFSHLFFNMFALWMFGRQLEYDLGSQKFLTYYMVCGIGAGLIQLAVSLVEPYSVTVGASGSVFGLLLAYGVLHPNNIIMLLIPPIPIKAKWFVVIYGALELFMGIRGVGNVAHFAHLGGMIWGFGLLYYWKFIGRIRF